jgi:hypothetical protein
MKRIVWILSVWPIQEVSAGCTRTLQLLDIAQKAGYKNYLLSACQDNQTEKLLTEQGYACHHIEPNSDTFDELIKSLSPEIVIFDRFIMEEQFSWRVRQISPHTIRILDTIDLHFLRRARERTARKDSHAVILDIPQEEELSEDTLRELASIYRSDYTLIVSSSEYDLLTQRYHLPEAKLVRCGLGCSVRNYDATFEEREHLVFVGNFYHAPNRDAFRILHEYLWPRIRKRLVACNMPTCELHLYGAFPQDHHTQISSHRTGIHVRGQAAQISEVMQFARVNLAPLRFGAGLKGKILDGWSFGVPAITTTIGAEGMHGELPFGGSISNDWEHFIEQVVSHYTDKELWSKSQRDGLAILKLLHTIEQVSSTFLGVLSLSQEEVISKRREQVTGEILWHHQFKSTEYMSRWISEKQKQSTK